MSKYILLLNWTEQGAKNVKDSASRYDAAKEIAKKGGCTLESVHMTFGAYDLVIMLDAPNDEAAATFNLRVTSAGNIRGVTLKAFPEAEYRRIVAGL
ncbi:GYD domain-containing protein [Devosia sp.]|uniref:GYD domain-containing protein n=1 Tax=Devosia sp. TaxID=1871048 RepID=UPI002EEDB626